jgi:hypothetical protein
MKHIKVEFETSVPDDVKDSDIQEWLNFSLEGGGMKCSNPLSDREINANNVDFRSA